MVKTQPLSIRLDPDVREEIEKLAAEEQRSLSNYVAKVLTDHIQRVRAAKKREKREKAKD